MPDHMPDEDSTILKLRDAFQSIEPSASQRAEWARRLAAAHRKQQARRAFESAVASEPLPWRVLITSGIAAVIMIGVFAGVVLSQGQGESGNRFRAAGQHSIEQFMAFADPADAELMQPVNDPRMQLDFPATGIDLRTHWETLRSVVDFALGGSDAQTTS